MFLYISSGYSTNNMFLFVHKVSFIITFQIIKPVLKIRRCQTCSQVTATFMVSIKLSK